MLSIKNPCWAQQRDRTRFAHVIRRPVLCVGRTSPSSVSRGYVQREKSLLSSTTRQNLPLWVVRQPRGYQGRPRRRRINLGQEALAPSQLLAGKLDVCKACLLHHLRNFSGPTQYARKLSGIEVEHAVLDSKCDDGANCERSMEGTSRNVEAEHGLGSLASARVKYCDMTNHCKRSV